MSSTDFLGNFWEYECMGCAIADQSMLPPGGIIWRTEHFCVHQDPLIPLPGFLVIASVRHIHSLSEMHESEYSDYSKLLRSVHQAIKQATQIEVFTLVQEESSSHFHLWFFPWTKAIRGKYGRPSLTSIRGIMTDYREEPISSAEWGVLEKSIQRMRDFLS